MKYISTRGHAVPQSFCDILLGGLAPDGGLYLPEHYPRVDHAMLARWRKLSYADLAFEILSLYIDDIPSAILHDLCRRTYTAKTYCFTRPGCDAEKITPLTWLKPGQFAIQALSNGPTLAFKDMAMQFLGNIFEYVLHERGSEINILGATSGDTGSAAEYAMRGKQGVRVFMLSPHGKMSAFQRAQMYSLSDKNIFNIAVTGMFDDAQDIVKAVSNDASFKARYKIGAVNSINWARVLAQIVYYFKGYFEATESEAESIIFSVPSGNFGNICAGHIARMMGLPIQKLILATNENNVLDEFFRTGVYRPRKPEETFVTSSPSMDISKASNFERFIYDLTGQDANALCTLWKQLEENGFFDLRNTPYYKKLAEFSFISGSSSHADRLKTIKKIWQDTGVMIDPHTADGVKVALEHMQPGFKTIVLETAQAVKFSETLKEAIGQTPPTPETLAGLEQLPQHVQIMPADVDAIKTFLIEQIGS